MRGAWAVAFALLVAGSGCLSGSGGSRGRGSTLDGPALGNDLVDASYNTEGPLSYVLEKGPLAILPVDDVRFPSFDGTEIASGVWRPETDEPTPVILMVSPYFSTGLFSPEVRIVDNMVPHGYTFAKVAIRGTSYSDGCMESMGTNEQKDIDAAVTFFGEQPWSNGNVAILGLSYVGTTPWAAATFGNPHLKTIVPMAGVTSWFELGFRNGTAEPRTPIHMPLYWAEYGTANEVTEIEPDDIVDLADNACAEPMVGLAASQYAIATGEMGPFADYWTIRDLKPGVLQNYNGSVFVVHGFRDWNVNADMAYPFATQLEDKGLQVKHWLGQWQHSAPDNVGQRDEHLRYDFAEILLRWFDTHLKGMPRYHGAMAEIEDNLGLWRSEPTWPPHDANWTAFHLGDGALDVHETTAGNAPLANPGGALDGADCPGTPTNVFRNTVAGAWFSTGPLDAELRYAGMAQLQLTVVPHDVRGGEVQANLYHVSGGEIVSRVNHAVMDLKFYKGGHDPQSLTPGQAVAAMMEFYPADVAIPAGDELALHIIPDTGLDPCTNADSGTGEDTIQGAYLPGQSPVPIEVRWGQGLSVLRLPVIERDVGDGKYDGQPA